MSRLTIGVKSRREHPLDVSQIPNCEFWVDLARAESITFAGGTNISQISDLSGKGKTLTKTGAGSDTVYPGYVCGGTRRVVSTVFTGPDDRRKYRRLEFPA
jgi:hypothetical protein